MDLFQANMLCRLHILCVLPFVIFTCKVLLKTELLYRFAFWFLLFLVPAPGSFGPRLRIVLVMFLATMQCVSHLQTYSTVQIVLYIVYCCSFSACVFSALTLLVGCQEEHPACKNWVMRCWCGCLEQGADILHMVQLMLLPSQNPFISCLI